MKTIIGNWKMNVGARESVALARGVLLALRGRRHLPEVVVCPPFTALTETRKTVGRTHVALGAQDVHWEETGAFTGEISPRMLVETGVSHVLIGHSERRRLFGETDETVGKKTAAALAHGLVPVVCVGETAEERDAGQTEAVVLRQLAAAFSAMPARGAERVFVAYEPVWAIGTGAAATPADAAAVHAAIRAAFRASVKGGDRTKLSVLYGGSADPSNAYAFLRETEIDGLLVGGASVKLQQFTDMIAAAADVLEGIAAAPASV